MTLRVHPGESPPMGFIVPFFLLAPLGLIVAGSVMLRTGPETFVAINAGQTVAVTHALALGWVSTVMMGACYQLGPVVLGGTLRSTRVIPVQLCIHIVAIGLFVASFAWLNVFWTGVAGSLLFVSIVLFLANAGYALWTAPSWSVPRAYLVASTAGLGLAATFGLVFAGNLEHGWFAMSQGKLASHAHLGLAGWLALTLMGVSYQLVPMFNIASKVKTRFAYPALFVTAGAVLLFAGAMWTDPGREVRMLLTLLLIVGPALWAVDQVRIITGRAKRRMDIHGRATIVSLCFLGLTMVLGLGAAFGSPFVTDSEPARWPLAYATAGLVGWAGTAIIANSFKIVPFLIWYHRYRPQMGKAAVPLIHDIYHEGAALGLLVLHSVSAMVLTMAALAGNLTLLHTGAVLLALSGAGHMASMLAMFLPKRSSRASTEVARETAS